MKQNELGQQLLETVYSGDAEAVKELISSFTDKQLQVARRAHNNAGLTALMIAAKKGYLAIVEILINQSGVGHVDEVSSRGSALMIAAEKGYLDIVKILINEAGANVNAVSSSDTALILAIENNRIPVVEFLLEAKANTELTDFMSKTALCYGFTVKRGLSYAAAKGFNEVVTLITAAQPKKKKRAIAYVGF
jgi:ankyrin repeat protein